MLLSFPLFSRDGGMDVDACLSQHCKSHSHQELVMWPCSTPWYFLSASLLFGLHLPSSLRPSCLGYGTTYRCHCMFKFWCLFLLQWEVDPDVGGEGVPGQSGLDLFRGFLGMTSQNTSENTRHHFNCGFLNGNGAIPVSPGDKEYRVMTRTKIYKVVFLQQNSLSPCTVEPLLTAVQPVFIRPTAILLTVPFNTDQSLQITITFHTDSCCFTYRLLLSFLQAEKIKYIIVICDMWHNTQD